tara:strand:- start:169 stop:360 length:192 start_codon:yes stop_codon:yes gene_type:complete
MEVEKMETKINNMEDKMEKKVKVVSVFEYGIDDNDRPMYGMFIDGKRYIATSSEPIEEDLLNI